MNDNSETLRRETMLIDAAARGHIEVMQALINDGVNINVQDDDGYSPLHWGVLHHNEEEVRLILSASPPPDVDIKDNTGQTPLHYAAAKGLKVITNLLLEHGADPNVVDAQHHHVPLTICGNQYNIAEALIAAGANVNIKLSRGLTPLHYAAENDYVDIIQLLLSNGACISARDGYGWTPLHSGTIVGRGTDALKVLIDAGADVNARDEDGQTPLHWAAICGFPEKAQLLLDRGADPTIENNRGHTAFHESVNSKNSDVTQLLLNHGARSGAKYVGEWLLYLQMTGQ